MSTFADLGLPFPLFEAPTSETGDYAGKADCHVCGGPDKHCFTLHNDYFILPCPSCGGDVPHFAATRMDATCRACGSVAPFPEPLRAEERLLACYDCVRAGRGAITKDTEFGMVSWEEATRGVTNGVPGLQTDQFEVVPIDGDGDWLGVRIPHGHLWELLRTPGFLSWQGAVWLFCCRSPMTYLGSWRNVLESIRPSDPDAFFEGLLAYDEEARRWSRKSFESGSPSLYIYRCRTCDRFRANYDCD